MSHVGPGPDGDHFQSGGPEVGPPTGNMTFCIYIEVKCSLSRMREYNKAQ